MQLQNLNKKTRLPCMLVLVLGVFIRNIEAQTPCLYLESVNPGESFAFGMALIESFSYAKQGLESEGEGPGETEYGTTKNIGELAGLVTDTLYAMKRANNDYRCAAEVLSGYRKSDNEYIAAGAIAATVPYVGLVTIHEESMTELKSLLDRVETESYGKRAEKYADMRLRRNTSWKLLLDATAVASYAFAHWPEDSDAGWDGRLNISSEERKLLIDRLDGAFGPSITESRII